MRKMTVLLFSLACMASATPLTPSKWMSGDVDVDTKTKPGTLNYVWVSDNWDDVVISHGPPSSDVFAKACRKATLSVLKAPATAKFEADKKPFVTYQAQNGTYIYLTSVDSQNSYGALVRGRVMCFGVYQGSKTMGSIYIHADVTTRR